MPEPQHPNTQSLLPLNELRELVNLDPRYSYSDADVVLSAYFRGLLKPDEVARYVVKIYGVNYPSYWNSIVNRKPLTSSMGH